MKLFGRVVFALPLRGVIVTIWDVGDLCVCVSTAIDMALARRRFPFRWAQSTQPGHFNFK